MEISKLLKKSKRIVSLKKVWPVVVIVVLLVLILPQHQAKAGCIPFVNTLTSCLIDGGTLVLTSVGNIISFSAKLLRALIDQGFFFPPQVQNAWLIIRNFVNMFFILVLIIMAFGTIFNLPKYDYRALLAGFLIAAILINFSFVIGQYILSIGNDISKIFAKTIGDVSITFGQGLSLQKLETAYKKPPSACEEGCILLNIVLAIFFLVFALIAIITAAIFVLIRIPFIWFLLIVSPIAWFGYAMPSIKAQTWDAWWKQFFGWTFFLPIYLFFLMFGAMFINSKIKLDVATKYQNESTTTALANFFQIIGLNDIFMFVVSLIFMIGGLGIAYKLSFLGGTQAANWMGKAEGGVKKVFKGTGRGALRLSGATDVYEGAKQGLTARKEMIQEKGILGFGGAQKGRLRQAQIAQFLGKEGASQQQLAQEIEKDKARLGLLNLDKNGVEIKLKTANRTEALALQMMKAENGWMAPAASGIKEMEDTIAKMGGSKTIAAKKYRNALDNSDFHNMFASAGEKNTYAASLTDLELKKTLYGNMAKNRQLVNEVAATTALTLFENDTKETFDRITKNVKESIFRFAPKKDDRKRLLSTTTVDDRIKKLSAQLMMENNEIKDYETFVLAKDVWGSTDPRSEELLDKINKDKEMKFFAGEIDFRTSRSIPAAVPLSTISVTHPEYTNLKTSISDIMVTSKPSDILSAGKGYWNAPAFRSVLIDKLNILESANPTVPAVFDPISGVMTTREKPGGGKRFYQSLVDGADTTEKNSALAAIKSSLIF